MSPTRARCDTGVERARRRACQTRLRPVLGRDAAVLDFKDRAHGRDRQTTRALAL